MSEDIKHVVSNDVIITISYDESPSNPLHDDWMLINIVDWHRRYKFGKHSFNEPDDFLYEAKQNKYIYKKLYMYEHGNISFSTTDFNDRFDSGFLGFVYIDPDDLKGRGLELERADDIINTELDIFEKYVNGEVFTVCIDRGDGDIEFISGIYDYEYFILCDYPQYAELLGVKRKTA